MEYSQYFIRLDKSHLVSVAMTVISSNPMLFSIKIIVSLRNNYVKTTTSYVSVIPVILT